MLSALSAQCACFEPEELERCIGNECIKCSVCSSPPKSALHSVKSLKGNTLSVFTKEVQTAGCGKIAFHGHGDFKHSDPTQSRSVQ